MLCLMYIGNVINLSYHKDRNIFVERRQFLQMASPEIFLRKIKGRAFCPASCNSGNEAAYRKDRCCFGKRRSVSCRDLAGGSVTVEAALVFPLFLFAVCSVIAMGQMMLVQTEVQHSVSQTAKICAKKAAGEMIDSQTKQGKKNVKAGSYKVSRIGAGAAFLSVYDGGSLCESVILGGKYGIRVTASSPGKEEIMVKASYILKVPVPLFKNFRFSDSAAVSRRIFSGYVEHGGSSGGTDRNQIVYVAVSGSVYHTNPECSHICLKISGSSAVKKIVNGSAYDACEKCIDRKNIPGNIYITAHGDCYHSSLSCSGLKRTIKTVNLSEVSGMRQCSRCAGSK